MLGQIMQALGIVAQPPANTGASKKEEPVSDPKTLIPWKCGWTHGPFPVIFAMRPFENLKSITAKLLNLRLVSLDPILFPMA